VIEPVECDGRRVRAIAPEVHDLAVSKLCRLDPKDREYVEALHAARPLDLELLHQRLAAVQAPDAVREQASEFIARLART
jgi:hypothetical protein